MPKIDLRSPIFFDSVVEGFDCIDFSSPCTSCDLSFFYARFFESLVRKWAEFFCQWHSDSFSFFFYLIFSASFAKMRSRLGGRPPPPESLASTDVGRVGGGVEPAHGTGRAEERTGAGKRRFGFVLARKLAS